MDNGSSESSHFKYSGITCNLCGWMCKLYTELVVHQLKIHKLTIQNVTKVSEVMPSHLMASVFDSSDTDDSKRTNDSVLDASIGHNKNYSVDKGDEFTDGTQSNRLKKCYKCNKNFSTFGSLRAHMMKIHGLSQAEARECTDFQCEEKAPRKSSLHSSRVVCQECNITFVRPTTLRTHYARVHQMNAAELDKHVPKGRRRKADEIMKTAAASIEGHDSDRIRTITTTQCYLCKDSFDGMPALFEHFYRTHEQSMPHKHGKKPPKPIEKSFECNSCNKNYQTRHNYHAHLIKVHKLTETQAWILSNSVQENVHSSAADQLLFECELCRSTHSNRYMLRQHIIRAHALNAIEAWNLSKAAEPIMSSFTPLVHQWICYVCKKRLAKKNSVRIHLERIHPIPFEHSISTNKTGKVTQMDRKECPVCHKKYRFDFLLQDHLRRSHNPKRLSVATTKKKSNRLYACKHCEMVFSRAWKLEEHIKSLKRNKSIMCKKCYAKFDSRVELVQHMEQNEKCKKRPMMKTALCNYCGEMFVNNTALDAHTRRHLNIRPFECDKCDWKFFTRLQLQRHQPVHVEEPQNFQCSVDGCTKSYSQLSYLKYHEKQKHIEPTLKCPQCDELFTTEKYRSYE